MGIKNNIKNISNVRVERGTTPLRRHHFIPQTLLRKMLRSNKFLEVYSVKTNESLGFVKPANIAYAVGDVRDGNVDKQEQWFALCESRFSNFIDLIAEDPFKHVPKERADAVRDFFAGLITRNPYQEEWNDVDIYKWMNLKKKKASLVKQTKTLSAVLRDRFDMRFIKSNNNIYFPISDVPWTIWDDTLVFPINKSMAIQFYKKGDITDHTIRLNRDESHDLSRRLIESGVNEYYVALTNQKYNENITPEGFFIGETYSNENESAWEVFHYKEGIKKGLIPPSFISEK